MADKNRTKAQLIEELEALRAQVAALEQSEAGRARAEEAYRALVEHSLQGLAILQDDRIIFANAALAEILGYSVEELLALSLEEIKAAVHPEDWALIWGRYQDRLAGKPVPSRYEFRLIRKDGAVRRVEMFSSLIEYLGKPAAQTAFVDITERVQAEEELRLAKLVIENSPTVVIRWKAEEEEGWPVVFVSENVAQFGYSVEELLSGEVSYASIVHPDDLERMSREVREYSRAGYEDYRQEYRIVTKDGEARWLDDQTVVERDADGRVTHYQGVLTDITGRKQAEEEVKRRNRELALLNQVIAAATSTLEVEKVLEVTCRELALAFDVPQVAAALLNDEHTAITVVAEYLAEGRPSAMGDVIPLEGNPATQYVIQHKSPLAIADAQTDPRIAPVHELMERRGTVSLLIVPLVVRDEVVGTIGVDATERREFSAEESELAASAAAAVAQVLDSARLFESERRQRQLAERLRGIGLVVGSSLDLEQVLEFVLDQLAKVVPYDYSEVQLLQGDVAVVIAERNMQSDRPREFPLEESPYDQRLAQGDGPLLVPDLRECLGWKFVQGAEDVRCAIGLPLIVRDRVIGILNIFSREAGHFGQEDVEVVAAFAQQAAIAIENARLYRALEERAGALGQAIQERTAELQRAKERVEAILTNSPDAILLLDADGTIRTGNLAFHQTFGYQFDETYTQPLTALAGPAHAGLLAEAVQRVVDSGESARLEIVAQRKDETTFDAEVALGPIREGGEVHAMVCSLRDISALKEVERMKDAFVSNVSHELRTPITSIKLYLSLLESGRPDRRPGYMSVLMSEADRMARLIDELLDISRIDAGRIALTLEPLRLAELVEVALNHYLPQAEAKSLNLRAELSPALPALADSSQMAQVLNNLMTNAINYTSEGEVVILTGQAEREGRHYTTLTVRDTGQGIPEDELPHVFERFYRGEQVRQSGIRGTGLGLAIVKEIVEMHGGLIEMTSQVGVGTSVSVWLPSVEE
jgi:PAS domain S-box-containing protein